MSGAGEGNRTLLPSVSFRRKACRYAVSGVNRLLVSAQFGTVFSTLYRQLGIRMDQEQLRRQLLEGAQSKLAEPADDRYFKSLRHRVKSAQTARRDSPSVVELTRLRR